MSLYLSSRTQVVMINGALSNSVALTRSVPQGSVLGPEVFSDFTNPVSNLPKLGIGSHFYADDYQFYIAFHAGDETDIKLHLTHYKILLKMSNSGGIQISCN
jgi:hypothetical protein